MKKKKEIALMLVLAIILIGLTGCGKEEKHNWKEANYQEPKTCIDCDTTKTEGEPIPPKFPSLGFKLSEVGKTYTYISCYKDKSDATGNVTVSEVQIIDGNDFYEPKEDYEWIIAKALVTVKLDPKEFQIGIERMDYYSSDLTSIPPVNNINYFGKDYVVENKIKTLKSTATEFEFETGYLVPKGYDGIILIFFNDRHNMNIDYSNPDTKVTLNDYIDKDTLFFRLKK